MKRLAWALSACLWAIAVAAYGQGAPSAAQAAYDEAQAAYDAGHWATAAAGFAKLLPTDPGQALRRSTAVMAYRYADCLSHLSRFDEAEAWVDRAIPALSRQTDQQAFAEALYVRGTVERLRYDYAEAVKSFDEADEVLAGKLDDLLFQVRAGLAFADVTRDPAHVLERLNLLTASPDFRKTASRAVQAEVEDLQARAEMNLGDFHAADRLASRAISDGGGLSERVSTTQVAARADAGVIAHFLKHETDVQQYFAYTGAGHLKDLGWVQDHAGDLPVCGQGPADVRADDLAVVTFAINDQGEVVNATPTYASRPGDVGQTFARAVSSWRWNPATIKTVEPFWRATLQLELRCVDRPSPLSVSGAAWRTLTAWLEAHDLVKPAEAAFADQGGIIDVGAKDPRLARPEGAVLAAVAAPPPATVRDMEALWTRLDAIHAPSQAYAALIDRHASSWGGATIRGRARNEAAARGEWLARMQARFPNDPATQGLLLDQAISLETSEQYAAAAPYLKSLLDLPDSQLANDAPLRAVALLHQAIVLDHFGQGQAARVTLEKSGLNSAQCSLFDTRPLPQNFQIGSEAFPAAAAQWRFEGFVQTDYSIGDDGRVQNVRAVISYPPFIFEDTTTRAVSRFRFEPPRLGGKTVGCEDERQVVNYRIAS